MFARKTSKNEAEHISSDEDNKQNSEDLALEEKIKRKLAQIKKEKEEEKSFKRFGD